MTLSSWQPSQSSGRQSWPSDHLRVASQRSQCRLRKAHGVRRHSPVAGCPLQQQQTSRRWQMRRCCVCSLPAILVLMTILQYRLCYEASLTSGTATQLSATHMSHAQDATCARFVSRTACGRLLRKHPRLCTPGRRAAASSPPPAPQTMPARLRFRSCQRCASEAVTTQALLAATCSCHKHNVFAADPDRSLGRRSAVER